MHETLTALDTAWLRMDQPTNPMMITSVIVLAGAVPRDAVRALVTEKLVSHARFSMRVVESRVPGLPPHWEPDPHFDVDQHLHFVGVPAPHDRAALEALVSDLASQPLDRSRPLWQLHVVDGVRLESGQEGTALVTRLHHCIGDGIALVGLLTSLTDEGRALTPPEPGHLRHAEGALDLAREAARQTTTLGRLLLLPADPDTPYRGALGTTKRVAWSRAIPLESVRAIAARIGGKINDVLMAACAGAMREDLLARGHTIARDVRVLVPVHIPGGRAGDGLGNHIGLVFVELPIAIEDRTARLAATKAHMDAVKEQPDATVALAVLGAMGVASREIEHIGVQLFATKATALVTNVPGPLAEAHLVGQRIEALMVWAPVSGGIGLGFSLLSYAGHVRLGVSSDAHLVGDPRRLVEAFEREIAVMD